MVFVIAILAKLEICFDPGHFDLKPNRAAHFFFTEVGRQGFHAIVGFGFITLDKACKDILQLGSTIDNARCTVKVHRDVIPGGHIELLVPGGGDIGVRSAEDQQHFLSGIKRAPELVGARHVAVDQPGSVQGRIKFHEQMRSNRKAVLREHQCGKIMLANKVRDLLQVFLAIIMRNIHLRIYQMTVIQLIKKRRLLFLDR